MARVRGAASGILRVSLVVCAVLGAASFQTATSFYPKLRCTAMLHVKTAKIGHTARGTVGAARSGSRAATARRLAMSSSPSETGAMTISYKTINIKTGPGSPQGISVWEITSHIREMLKESGVKNGFVNVISRHTTTALTINEYEGRLRDDMREFFAKLAPPEHPYLHNAIHERPNPGEDTDRVIANGWDITDPKVLEAWRAQEPFNAHSHLLSMMLGNSETIPVADGNLVIGQWQNVLFLDLDGDRERTVGIQIVGVQ